MLFGDTSTLAKYSVPEADSAAIRARLDAEDQVAFSDLARAELMGVFHRRLRDRKWTRDEFLAVVRQFSLDDRGGYWAWLPLDVVIVEGVVKTYATLPENIFLRTVDCLHLVTALHHGFQTVYTHDVHQLQTAAALGLNAVQIE